MNAKHTPGPWSFDENSEGRVYSVDETGFKCALVATVQSGIGEYHKERRQANAKLIASAPDLLEALEGMIKVWEGPRARAAFAFADAVKTARAAIAKVKS